MKQRTIYLTLVFALMFFLSLGNITTASAQPQPEVIKEVVPFASLQPEVTNPCTEGNIQITEGTIHLTILNIEVETPSGFEMENELMQVRGTALGEDGEGNIYNVSLNVTVDDECGIGDVDPGSESCQVVHATFRSRTTSNFTATGVLKLVGGGQTVLNLTNLTCQSRGRIEI